MHLLKVLFDKEFNTRAACSCFRFTFSSCKASKQNSAYSYELSEVVASLDCLQQCCLKLYLRLTECWQLSKEYKIFGAKTACYANKMFVQISLPVTWSRSIFLIIRCFYSCSEQNELRCVPLSVYTTVDVARLVGQCSNWLCAVPCSDSVTAVRTLTLASCWSSNTVFMFIVFLIHTSLNDLGRMCAYYGVTLTLTSVESHIGITCL